MRIISRKAITDFCKRYPRAEKPLRAWYADAKQAQWTGPSDIKKVYRNVSVVANNRVIFNIKGNDFRLIVAINYKFGIVYIRFIGTHREYDKVDALTI